MVRAARQLRFLGTSDSQGVPRWWCRCAVCEEARTTRANARTRPSVVIEGSERILIDCAPELRLQCVREDIGNFDAVLITHAHNDHILGLGDLGDRARWTREPCPVFAPAEVLPQIASRFEYMSREKSPYLCYVPMAALENTFREFAGYRATPIQVPHGFNGWSYAFRMDSSSGSWGYMPDCLGLEDLEPWRNLDVLVLGTSFYREPAPLEGRSVYDVMEAVELVSKLGPKRTILTHLGHGVNVRRPPPEGIQYARDGLIVPLP